MTNFHLCNMHKIYVLLVHRLQTFSFNLDILSVSTDRVLHPAHRGERIHSLGCRRPLRCCVSAPYTVSLHWSDRTFHFGVLMLQTENLNSAASSFQVSLLAVWQSDRNAVSGQRCVCFAAAAPLLSHDGTSAGRPLLGTSLSSLNSRNTKIKS